MFFEMCRENGAIECVFVCYFALADYAPKDRIVTYQCNEALFSSGKIQQENPYESSHRRAEN